MSFDADAAAYITAVETADNQPLEPGVKNAINAFVVGCKSDNIWTAIKAACIMAGARTLAGALVPLVGAAPTNVSGNFVEADYARKTGLLGDGTAKFLNSNRNNNADSQNNKHIASYSTTTNGTGVTIGTPAGETGRAAIFRFAGGANISFRVHSATGSTGGSNTSTGMIGASRSASGSFVARSAQSNTIFSVASQTPSSSGLNIFAASAGEAISFCSDRISWYSIGESLDLALLDTRLTTLMTALGDDATYASGRRRNNALIGLL